MSIVFHCYITTSSIKSVFTKGNYPIPTKDPSPYPNIPDITFGINSIDKLLKNLTPNKASNPDQLPACILKETSEQIAPIVRHIFQQSYNTHTLPDDWLKALATAIYKKSHKWDPANY